MLKKKVFKKVLTLGALSVFCCNQAKDANAYMFVTPENPTVDAQNRPSLKLHSIPQVWEAFSTKDEFKKAYDKQKTPESKQEKKFKALTYFLESMDLQSDIFMLEEVEQKNNTDELQANLKQLEPLVVQSVDNTSDEIELAELQYLKLKKEDEAIDNLLNQLRLYFDSIEDIATINLGIESVLPFLDRKESEENALIDNVRNQDFQMSLLENSENMQKTETNKIRGLKDVDNVFWALEINDMVDLSTGFEMFLTDDMPLIGAIAENQQKSASLLDNYQKNQQILKEDISDKKQLIFEMLQKAIELEKYKTEKGVGQK